MDMSLFMAHSYSDHEWLCPMTRSQREVVFCEETQVAGLGLISC